MKSPVPHTSAAALGSVLRDAVRFLDGTSPTPRLDAEVLLMHVSGFDRGNLIARDRTPLPEKALQEFQRLLQRRKQGEPIAYLTGVREFWSMELNVSSATLIPRPETELLVEKALERIPENVDWRIADLGTGSGAIALALAKERPHCAVIATDLSHAALAVARSNAEKFSLPNVEFRAGDWFTCLVNETLDMIASNPPYVRVGDPHLQADDVRHEPLTALVSGMNGLDAIRHIIEKSPRFLKSGGWLLLEHGWDQAGSVQNFLRQEAYRDSICFRDLAGHGRVTAGRR